MKNKDEHGLEAMNEHYQPGEDENQGPLEAWARSEQVNPQTGAMQNPQFSPNAMQGGTDVQPKNQGTELEKAERTDADGTNDAMLTEEDIEPGDALNAAGNPNEEDPTGAGS
ncbi:hypothetical protein [Tellurirhabdus rosea]|uniref:hypothetical protein n=1 Tax=Tellurirhabdus rosea TaxID=2674997 RepID=UPI002251133C|nr:hypothetical protein [Tellurirhabdus rosea]